MDAITYARARLWLGITGVGLVVTAAATLLLTGMPARLFGGVGGSFTSDVGALALLFAVVSLAVVPLDVLGGYVLPRRFDRPTPTLGRFALNWARGIAVLASVSALSGAVLLAAGRVGGRPAALGAMLLTATVLTLGQETFARWIGGLRRVRPSELGASGVSDRDAIVLEGDDPGFSGGFTGPSSKLVLPARWLRLLDRRQIAVLVERRQRILLSGDWRRAFFLALAWNGTGFVLASLLPGAGVTTLAELVATGLGFTLWTFLGLLFLPTPSRRATVTADARIADRPEARENLSSAVRVLDLLQDDEPERSAQIESVFHPVPSVQRRLRALSTPRRDGQGAWHLARTTLWLSHAGLSLLPRVVHCNVGRPELWVYMPADG